MKTGRRWKFLLGSSQPRAQGLVEFALVLPLLLLLIFGIIEVGRLLVIFSSISSAAKQAARYGSVGGDSGNGTVYYLNCVGIRNIARGSAILVPGPMTVTIVYDRGYITDTVGYCDASNNAVRPYPVITSTVPMTNSDIKNGYRVGITLTAVYRPIVPIVPLPPIPLTFQASRSIFPLIEGPTPTPKPPPDVAVAKTGSPPVVAGGANATYVITVTNNSPSTAASTGKIVLTDTVASGWSFVSATGTDWTCNFASPRVVCTYPVVIDVGASAPALTIVLQAPTPAGTTTYTNSVTAISTRGDTNMSDNTATAQTTVAAGADLAITKTDSPDPVATSNPLIYTLNVVSNGSQAASNVRVTDTLPSGLTSVPVVTFGSTGTVWGGCPIISTTQVVCTMPTLAAYASARPIYIQITAPGAPTTLSNSAVVGSATSDPIPGNNSSGVITTTVRNDADLWITKLQTPASPAGPDDIVDYTLRVTNNGPATASNVSVTDALPAGLQQLVSVTAAGWSCPTQTLAQVICTTASLGPGVTASDIVIRVKMPPLAGTPTNLTDSAVVSATSLDPDLSNNTATLTTQVDNCHHNRPDATLSVVQASPSPANVLADNLATGQVQVTARDDCGNIITGTSLNISLAVISGQGTVNAPNPVSTTNGQATFTVKYGTVTSGVFQATAGSTPITSSTPTFNWICVTGGTFNSLNPQDLRFLYGNGTGTNRRLSSLTVNFPDSGSNQMISIVFTSGGSPLTIWTGNANSGTITGFAGTPTINNGAGAILDLNFNFAVGGTGTFQVTAQWTDTANASSVCTTPTITVNP